MTYPTAYPRPPIVEAVIDFRFSERKFDGKALDALVDAIGSEFPGRESNAEAEGDEVITDLSSPDGRRHLLCAKDQLSVHVLAPYPGWESFLATAQQAVGALPVEVRASGLSAITVRYIDRISLREKAPVFNEYVTLMPNRPPGFPDLAAFSTSFMGKDLDSNNLISVYLASLGPNEDGNKAEQPALIYEVRVGRLGTIAFDNDEAWVPIVEELHQRQREVFEASITDKTRELFQ